MAIDQSKGSSSFFALATVGVGLIGLTLHVASRGRLGKSPPMPQATEKIFKVAEEAAEELRRLRLILKATPRRTASYKRIRHELGQMRAETREMRSLIRRRLRVLPPFFEASFAERREISLLQALQGNFR